MLPVTALAALALLQGAPQNPPAQTPPVKTPPVQTPPAQVPPAQAPITPPVPVPPPSVTPPAAPAPDKVIATIGGAPITAAELAPYLWSWRAREVVNLLAIYRGVAAEAARLNITVTDEEVKAKYDEQTQRAAQSLQPGQTLDDVFAQAGGLSGLALALKSTLLLDKIADREIDPSGYSKISMILFRSADDKPPTVTAAKTADVAYAQLKSGTPWTTVEKKYEKEPQLLQAGGSVGWTSISQLPPEAKVQLTGLKPQGYTKPIAMPGGVAIFRLDAQGKDASATDLAPLKSNLMQAARQAVINRIRANSKVEFK